MRDDPAAKVHEALNARGLAGKRDYVRSLEQRKDPQALTLLVECLSDESGYLRELAEAALAKLGEREPQAGAALLPLLKHGLWFARASAARGLGRMAYAPGAGALLELTEDPVASGARGAVASHGSAVGIAWELHRTPDDRRAARLAKLRAREAALADRVVRLLRADRLMSQPAPDSLRDDAPHVRAWEEKSWREEQQGAEKGAAPAAPPAAAAPESGSEASPR